jgi:cardiolipin synthase
MPSSVPPVPKPYAERVLGEDAVALLRDGEQAYPAMLAAIAGAERTICFETYILRDDTAGKRFLDALMERARTGVCVLLMFDAWGSRVSDATLEALEASGVTVRPFRPWRFAGSLARSLARHRRRNHRKSLVVDGRVAFTGGMNVSDDYAAVSDGGEGWRDTNLRIEGPSARSLERLFLETWRRNRGPKPDLTRFGDGPVRASPRLRIVGNGFVRESKRVRRAYLEAFAGARERIFITNAYFLPPANVVRQLVAATKRGVRVAVILAATTDVKLVLYAARGLYPVLLRGGIELYEWTDERVLHAKTAVVDGRWTTVGSTNLDPLSLMQNLEVNAIVDDAGFGASAEQLFLEDLGRCRRITVDDVSRYGLLERALSWLAWRLRLWL